MRSRASADPFDGQTQLRTVGEEFESGCNPLLSESPHAWDRLVEAVHPPSLLALIDLRLGPAVARLQTPEDIFQQAFLQVWRDRRTIEWRGIRRFRALLLTIIDHQISDAAERELAQKRGGGSQTVAFSLLDGSSSGFEGPTSSTTPSRLALHREQARAIREALNVLPDELNHVVRLRLLEQRTAEDVADELGLSVSAVHRRFRKGIEIYRKQLRPALGITSAEGRRGRGSA